jgi:L-lactate utilization protein LutC
VSLEDRVQGLLANVEKLAGKGLAAASAQEARQYVASLVEGKTAVASNAAFLQECGITGIAGVQTGYVQEPELRAACATADFGITSADYALADTGTLVMLSSQSEARLVSLLPPVHIALVPRQRILTGLDELFTVLPLPAEQTSSMVLITGPSRTADIEQILVRGVHGPGEIHVIVV